mgnify:CR=1 FL=1
MIETICNIPNAENEKEYFVTIRSTEEPDIVELVTWDLRGTTVRNKVRASDIRVAVNAATYANDVVKEELY